MRTALASCICVLFPALAFAQNESPQLPRNEVTLSVGWAGARLPDFDTYTQWAGSAFGGLGVGRYWTENLKTDIEAGWLGRAHARTYESVMVGADRAFVQNEYAVRDLKLSLAQSIQFGRQAWVHPFLGAGVDIGHRRTTEDRAPQQTLVYASGSTQGRSVLVPGFHEDEAEVRAVPFAKGGFKIYLTDRAFVVQEFKVGIGSGADYVLWKTGVGIDF